VDVKAETKQGNTALPLALHSRHEVVVRLLMENGADIEATDLSGRTPLISAVKSGIDQIVALLLEMRANSDSSGETALIVAAKMGSRSCSTEAPIASVTIVRVGHLAMSLLNEDSWKSQKCCTQQEIGKRFGPFVVFLIRKMMNISVNCV
jgi:hypothetical protein